MKKRVAILRHQSPSFDITTTHTFNNRMYEVDDNGTFYRSGRSVHPKPDGVGSLTVCLTDDNGSPQRFKIHQITLQTFCGEEMADGLSVDHIDKNRANNSLWNLRWATRAQQYRNRENSAYKNKAVICNENGKVFASCKLAEDCMGLKRNTVARVARGERKHTGGFTFSWSTK